MTKHIYSFYHNFLTALKFSYSYNNYSLDGCRWSPNTEEPLLFVKYDQHRLNILDVEKKAFILKEPIQTEFGQWEDGKDK